MSQSFPNEELWTCIDDGSGRNVYYLSADNKKVSKEPPNFTHRVFDNGERVFVFRGKCVLCFRTMPHIALSKNNWHEVFSINVCELCIFRKTGITQLKGNGDIIYSAFQSAPKSLFINLESRSLDPTRESIIHDRAKSSKYDVLRKAKARRNVSRYMICKVKAGPYNINSGSYLSWGFGQEFDEYFGKINSSGVPHGLGVKFYSDGSVYVGGWSNGRQHTEGKGTLTRPSGASYEGSWMQGRKHGKGEQIFADGRVFIGEFANGFEHGRGRIKYPDGGYFEGRFRFGRRDGPGMYKNPDGIIEKVSEEEQDSTAFTHAESLQAICLHALSDFMRRSPHLVPAPPVIQKRCVNYLKPRIGQAYLSHMVEGSEDFKKHGPDIAYTSLERVCLGDVRMNYNDVLALIYFAEANYDLKKLHIISAKLDFSSFELLARNISRDIWPNLLDLDISFNRVNYEILKTLMDGLPSRPALRKLRLAGCQINAGLLPLICNLLVQNTELQELDIAFNYVALKGAEILAQAITQNNTLRVLNIRHNSIGRDGGMYFAEALRFNRTLRQLHIADNNVGEEVMTLISGRLAGSLLDVAKSVCHNELKVPDLYKPESYGVIKSIFHVRAMMVDGNSVLSNFEK